MAKIRLIDGVWRSKDGGQPWQDAGTDGESVLGSEQDDDINGTHDSNSFKGLGGDDFIRTKGGADYAEGGQGDDRIFDTGNYAGTFDSTENLIRNGTFDWGHDRSPGQWGTYTSLDDEMGEVSWYADGDDNDGGAGYIEIQNGSFGGTPSNELTDGSVMELDSHNGSDTNATVSQDFTVEHGSSFHLDFQYAVRSNPGTSEFNVAIYDSNDNAVAMFSFKADGTGDVDISGLSPTDGYQAFHAMLDLEAGDYKISFMSSGDDDTIGALIDNVSLIGEVGSNDEFWGDDKMVDDCDSPGGDDLIRAGAGEDELYGQSGDDALHGGRGDDLMHGGNDNDFMRGGHGDDVMYGDGVNSIGEIVTEVMVDVTSNHSVDLGASMTTREISDADLAAHNFMLADQWSAVYMSDGGAGAVDGWGAYTGTSEDAWKQHEFEKLSDKAEVAKIELGMTAVSATVSMARFYSDDGSTDYSESVDWYALDSDGNVVAMGSYDALDHDNGAGTGAYNGNGANNNGGESSFTINSDVAFTTIIVAPGDLTDGTIDYQHGDNSDMLITDVTFTHIGTEIGYETEIGQIESCNEGDDVIKGEHGDDTIYGGGGNDDIMGGNDNDWIDGGAGADRIDGGHGDDTVVSDSDDWGTPYTNKPGTHAFASVDGGKGYDTLIVNEDVDTIGEGIMNFERIEANGNDVTVSVQEIWNEIRNDDNDGSNKVATLTVVDVDDLDIQKDGWNGGLDDDGDSYTFTNKKHTVIINVVDSDDEDGDDDMEAGGFADMSGDMFM